MDLSGRVSRGEYSRLAARWRRLAVDATTPQTRNPLLTLARQCPTASSNWLRLDGKQDVFYRIFAA